MKIEEVITKSIIAICRNRKLSELLILKGGGAMRLFDRLESRLSVDADFSVRGAIDPNSSVFDEMKESLDVVFREVGFTVIDFNPTKRPKRKRKGFPEGWGGWSCEFKLVAQEHYSKPLNLKRRNVFIPEGASSPKISIDLSEFEYCGKQRSRNLQGARIRAYSREMMVLEKIRAICQQHPEYAYRQQGKNRARDLFDIYELTRDTDEEFIRRCKFHLKSVFLAKEVPLRLLGSLWSDSFIDELRRGFGQVRDTVKTRLHGFDVYVEHLRFLILEIYPDVVGVQRSFNGQISDRSLI